MNGCVPVSLEVPTLLCRYLCDGETAQVQGIGYLVLASQPQPRALTRPMALSSVVMSVALSRSTTVTTLVERLG